MLTLVSNTELSFFRVILMGGGYFTGFIFYGLTDFKDFELYFLYFLAIQLNKIKEYLNTKYQRQDQRNDIKTCY